MREKIEFMYSSMYRHIRDNIIEDSTFYRLVRTNGLYCIEEFYWQMGDVRVMVSSEVKYG